MLRVQQHSAPRRGVVVCIRPTARLIGNDLCILSQSLSGLTPLSPCRLRRRGKSFRLRQDSGP